MSLSRLRQLDTPQRNTTPNPFTVASVLKQATTPAPRPSGATPNPFTVASVLKQATTPAPRPTSTNMGDFGAAEANLPVPTTTTTPELSSEEEIGGIASGIFDQFTALINGASAEGQRFLAQSMEGFMSTLDSAQNQIMGMFQQQMNGVDPATQMALQQLRENAQEYRRSVLEDLNRRGLLQSGIAVESELRLNRNQLTAEQQVLSQRVAELQGQMNNALVQFSQSRLQALQQFGLTGVQMAQDTGQQRVTGLQTALNQALNQTQFQQNTRQANRTFTEGVRQFDLGRQDRNEQFAETTAMSREAAERAARQFTQQMGYNWANLSARQRQDAIDNEMKKTQFEFEKSQVPAGASASTNNAIMEFRRFPDRETALTNYRRSDVLDRMIRDGVDVNRVYEEIMKMPEGRGFVIPK